MLSGLPVSSPPPAVTRARVGHVFLLVWHAGQRLFISIENLNTCPCPPRAGDIARTVVVFATSLYGSYRTT